MQKKKKKRMDWLDLLAVQGTLKSLLDQSNNQNLSKMLDIFID